MINLKEIDKDTIIPNFDEIVFDNVTYSYDNDNNIIQDFNFVIKKGNKVRISGPSGIGKTTIFMLILGFIKPNKGSIYFNYSGKKYQANYNTRGLISYVSQETILFSGSILDNIKILTGIDDIEKINESLKLVNLYDEINKMKNGLNTILRDKGEGLSKGQVQRLLIAISILYDKPIMMLDEFSSALDKDNEKKIIDNLSNLNKTIIFISHKDVLVSSDVNIKLGE